MIFKTLLVNPIFNILIALYHLVGSMGLAIILLTLLIKLLLLPVVLPSIKSLQKQRDLQPQLDKLRKKYRFDKQKLAQKQMELFKQHGLNPAAGCFTQFWMLLITLALYNVIRTFSKGLTIIEINDLIYFDFLKFAQDAVINTRFLYLDLLQPDPYYITGILVGLFQFLSSKMMRPYTEMGEKAAKKTPDKKDDVEYNVQEQMLYMMPFMMVLISLRLPAGAVLYLLISTFLTIVQNYLVSGWGGLAPLVKKLGVKV
jgi:YidC/Oxa1 family membrane protein insertase